VLDIAFVSAVSSRVDEIEAVRASNFNRIQQGANISPQQVQYHSITGNKTLQISIGLRRWIGQRFGSGLSQHHDGYGSFAVSESGEFSGKRDRGSCF
jgi:hypothetical protein